MEIPLARSPHHFTQKFYRYRRNHITNNVRESVAVCGDTLTCSDQRWQDHKAELRRTEPCFPHLHATSSALQETGGMMSTWLLPGNAQAEIVHVGVVAQYLAERC